jgi:hypothetical protein
MAAYWHWRTAPTDTPPLLAGSLGRDRGAGWQRSRMAAGKRREGLSTIWARPAADAPGDTAVEERLVEERLAEERLVEHRLATITAGMDDDLPFLGDLLSAASQDAGLLPMSACSR